MHTDLEQTGEQLVANIQQASIIVTVVRVNNLIATNQDIYVQIRTDETYGDKVSYEYNAGKKTCLVSLERATWNQHFYYNTRQLVDDNLTFIVKQRDGVELGRQTYRNVKDCKKQQVIGSTEEIKLELYNDHKQFIGTLEVLVQFKQNRDVIGGICMPDLSLAPKYPYEPKYNAIDGYNPNVKTNRANCFSFYDGDMVPGFDYIDIYPPKFKHPKDLQ